MRVGAALPLSGLVVMKHYPPEFRAEPYWPTPPPTHCTANPWSPAGAKGIAQFLDGTWNGSWNTYRGKCSRDAFEPACAIPAMALFMRLQRAEAISRAGDIPGIRARMAARSDVSDAQLNAINWSDRYQIALMAYHAGWDYDYWGPRTADYPVLVYRHAYQ